MKLLIAVLVVALAAVVFGLTVEQEWQEYKVCKVHASWKITLHIRLAKQHKFNKKYEPAEDVKRFDIFRKKLSEFEAHNEKFKRGEVTWEVGVNQFTDETEEESRRNLGLLPEAAHHA